MEEIYFLIKKAFEMGATHVVEIHGDGQYDLENINDIIKNLKLKILILFWEIDFIITKIL